MDTSHKMDMTLPHVIMFSEHALAQMNRRGITKAQIKEALTVKPLWNRKNDFYLSLKTLPAEPNNPLVVAWTYHAATIVVKTAYWKDKPEPTGTPVWKGVVEVKKSRRVLQSA